VGSVRAREILASGEPLLSTDHVVVETWLLLNSHLGRRAAERFWGGLREARVLIESVNSADLDVAWEAGDAFPDQDFSLVDRTSFVIMRRLGLLRVVTFDHHFAVYRFGRNRDKAFEIVR
jgi:uncharacterized protein